MHRCHHSHFCHHIKQHIHCVHLEGVHPLRQTARDVVEQLEEFCCQPSVTTTPGYKALYIYENKDVRGCRYALIYKNTCGSCVKLLLLVCFTFEIEDDFSIMRSPLQYDANADAKDFAFSVDCGYTVALLKRLLVLVHHRAIG